MEGAGMGEYLTMAGGAMAIGASVIAWLRFIRPGWRAAKRLYQGAMAVHELIEAQLRPNGGSSLVDRVAEQGTALARVEKRLESGDARFDAHEARLAALEQAAKGGAR